MKLKNFSLGNIAIRNKQGVPFEPLKKYTGDLFAQMKPKNNK
jgi:hypothetical protein